MNYLQIKPVKTDVINGVYDSNDHFCVATHPEEQVEEEEKELDAFIHSHGFFWSSLLLLQQTAASYRGGRVGAGPQPAQPVLTPPSLSWPLPPLLHLLF